MISTSLAHPIDIGILVGFLIVTLVVGLRYGRSVKTLRDYALGGKNFSTFTLTATIVATWIGGDAIFYIVTNVYRGGLYFIIPILGWVACMVLIGQLVARMGEFLTNVSVAEAMGDLYGRNARIITAAFGILSCIGCIAIQLKVTSMVITLMCGVTGPWVAVVAGLIVITYSALGGIKSVTYTDIFQFLTFGTFIPIIALVIWNNLKNPGVVIDTLAHNSVFSFTEVVGFNSKFVGVVALLAFFVIPSMDPAIFQRVAMGRDIRQTKQAFTYAAVPFLFVLLSMIWISILLLSADDSLSPDDLVSYIVHQYAYPGLKGLLGTGIVAMAMSTSDSYINSSAILLSNDIAKPFNILVKDSVRTARLFAFVGGGLALILAISAEDLLRLALLPGSFYMPVVTVPLVMAIFGFRSSARAAFIGMILGFTAALSWKLFLEDRTEINCIAPGMLANLLGLMGSHYLLKEKGGWQQLAPDSPLALERVARRQAWQWRFQAIKNFKLYPYLQQNLPTQEGFYFFFGLYTMAATYAAFYTIGDADVKAYQGIYEGIYRTVLLATTAFLTFPIWPPTVKSKAFITFFWPLGIGAILFFAGTLLVIMSHFHHMQVMVMMLNFLVAVLLLRWPLALFLAFMGTALAVFFFKHYTGDLLPLSAVGSLQFKIMYGLLLFTSFLIALFKGKQTYRQLEVRSEHLITAHRETTEELFVSFRDKAKFVKAFRAAGAPALTQLASLSSELRAEVQRLNLPQSVIEKVKVINEQLAPIAIQLDRLDHRAVGYLRLEVTTIPIDTLLSDVQGHLHVQNIDQHVRFRKLATQVTLQCDVAKIKTLLIRSISFLRTVTGAESSILLSVEDTQLVYPLPSVKLGYSKKVAALRLSITTATAPPQLLSCYTARLNATSTPVKAAQELPIVSNKRIVEAHYGYETTIMQQESSTLLYVIPVKLREVRGKDTDNSCMELGADLSRADDTYPGAKEQESIFLEIVEQRTQADRSLVHKAMEMIKVLHGPVRRKSGEPFYLHPLAVAQIVLDYNQDEATMFGALLHDTVEDTPMLLENIEAMFGKEVAQIVDGVTHLESNQATFYKVQLSAHENIRKLLEVKDKRVLYIKIADRMHNMRTLEAKPYESQHRTAEETLLFYVPLAEKLGLMEAAEELKRRSFEVLHSE